MKRSSIVLAGLLTLASLLLGQSGTGTVQGVVTDPAGAVVPAARIEITHLATSRTYNVQSNASGLFVQPSLQVGEYKVTVNVQGFKPWEGKLTLQAGQVAIVKPELALTTTSTEVTVAGDVTPLVVTESATLGQVTERARIEQLPLNGRLLTSLVGVTTPGLESGRVFGLRETAFEYIQDGAVLKNRDTGGHTGRPPGLDTVAEFKVETNNSSARFNRPASVQIVTRSGTNQWRGALFETARNNGLGVARRRQDYYDKPPQLVRNEYGGSFGGPVILPKLYNGRNRTFFFGSYEGYRLRQNSTFSTSMPTAQMREGDFSGLIDSLGRPITLYDPLSTTGTWSRTPFIGNKIPIQRRSPVATYLYSVTPLPTFPERNPLVTSNYFGVAPNNRDDNTLTMRFDHRVTDKDQVFVRYTRGDSWQKYKSSAISSAPTTDGSTNVTNTGTDMQNGAVSWTRTWSPTLFSETLATVSSEIFDVSTGIYEVNYAGQLKLPNPFNEVGFPYIYGTGFGQEYTQADTRRNNRTLMLSIDQNFTKMAGRHELQFGARFRNERMHVLPDQQYVSGNHSFSSGATGLYDPASGSSYSATPRTGHDSANLFLGVAGSYAAQFVQKWYRFRDREYAFYLQDNFRVNSRLTLNLGVRWEMHPAFHEMNNLFTGFDRKSRAIVNGRSLQELYKLGATTPEIVSNFTRIGVNFTTPDQVGIPSSMVKPNNWDFGPRAGFAWRTGGQKPIVVRGGYSLFTFPFPLRNFNASTRSNPPFNAMFTQSFTSAAQSPDGRPNYTLRSVPTIFAGVNSENVIDPTKPGGVARGGMQVAYFNPNMPSTLSHQWNLTVEREIFDSTVLRVGYVGNHASRLEQFYTYNEAAPAYVWFATTGLPLPTGDYANVARRGYDQTTYGRIMEFGKTGYSNFNGAQVEVQRRFKNGYAFQFYYVLTNAFRAAGNGWRDDFIAETNQFMPGAVPADIDERNRFLNYRRDTDMPKHRLRWNWLVDLPFGTGKPFGRDAGPWLNRLIGGWQVAGFGTYRSNYWALPTGNWGEMRDIEIYGTRYPIQDCRSGACIPGYLYFNGYIPATRINSYDSSGKPNGVMGVPDNFKPAQKPIIPIPATPIPNDPLTQFYDSNTVWVPMKDGSLQRTTMDTGLHPWRNQFLPGPWNFGLDASIFKNVRITETVNLRLNADFFNVLNNPGMGQPNSTSGIISLQSSANGPRELQLTLRLSF